METICKDDKVTRALATLKSELMSIREQDVDLMKQLLKINNTLKDLSSNNSKTPCRNRNEAMKHSRRHNSMNMHFTNRRGSYESSNGSLSSIEECTDSCENSCERTENQTDSFSGSEEDLACTHYSPLKSYTNFSRCSSDEQLLISNIKVWKYKQSRSCEQLPRLNNSVCVS